MSHIACYAHPWLKENGVPDESMCDYERYLKIISEEDSTPKQEHNGDER